MLVIRNGTGLILLRFVFQELKKQVETAAEREKKLKSELKKIEKDLKTELDKNKVCSTSVYSLQQFTIFFTFIHLHSFTYKLMDSGTFAKGK